MAIKVIKKSRPTSGNPIYGNYYIDLINCLKWDSNVYLK